MLDQEHRSASKGRNAKRTVDTPLSLGLHAGFPAAATTGRVHCEMICDRDCLHPFATLMGTKETCVSDISQLRSPN